MQADIITGDCLDVMSSIEPGSVNLVFADPKYNEGVPYGDYYDDAMSATDYLALSERWIQAAARTLAPDGSMRVFISERWADEYGLMLRRFLHRRQRVIWYESFGVNCPRKFNRTDRHLFHMVRDPRHFTFNRAAVTTKSARQSKYDDKRANP